MKRVGTFFLVLAAVVTIGCGGAESVGSSPTAPSSPGGSNPSQPTNPSSSAPSNLAVVVNGSTVVFTWTGVSGANQYSILVGSTPSSSDKLSTNTTQTNYTGTFGTGVYYARVQAMVNGVWSGSSNEVSFTIS